MPYGEVRKRFTGRLVEDVLGYWRLYEYLKLRGRVLLDTSEQFTRAGDFWYSILRTRFAGPSDSKYRRIRHGQRIRLKGMFATEWVPKMPGQIWTPEAAQDLEPFGRGRNGPGRQKRRTASLTEHPLSMVFKGKSVAILRPGEKASVLGAGHGTIRPKRCIANDDNYALLNFVSPDSWHCDQGVPVVVSRPVYERYLEAAEGGAPEARSLEGVLVMNDDPPYRSLIPAAIGAELRRELESALRVAPGLPRVYIYVASPLSVSFKTNDSHPPACAWTLYSTRRGIPQYTFSEIDPTSEEELMEAVGFLHEYMSEFGGGTPITDFDGQTPRLDSRVGISTNPWRSRKAQPALAMTLREAGRDLRR